MKTTQLRQQQRSLINIQQKTLSQSPKKHFKYIRQKAVHRQMHKLTDLYIIGQKVGSGAFGQVYKIQHKQLKLVRAVKMIKKSQKTQNHDPRDELVILKELDHPNVLKIYQYFENEYEWQIVTQYFQGHQLFDQITLEKCLSEKKAAEIFVQLCKPIAYIHSRQIVHRDLKPQNILVKRQSSGYVLKLIDWGLGCKAIKQLERKCGTPQYCAPEVCKGNYGYQCDLWSLGVILFVMLVGKFPFKGQNVKETLTLVSKAQFKFNSPEWDNISQDAKLLISKLLQKDPKARISASQCLNHPWIVKNLQSQSKQQIKLQQTLKRLKQINFQNKFQAIVINYIHNYLQSSQKQLRLKKQFELLDENKDGVLSYEELKKGYQQVYGLAYSSKLVHQIFQKMDINNSKSIQYSQFLTYGTQLNNQISNHQLRQAFRHFDLDDNGKIDKKELSHFLFYQKKIQSRQFNQLIAEIDQNKDGEIDFEEFVLCIKKTIQGVLHSSQSKNDQYFVQDLALTFLDRAKTKKQSFKTFSNSSYNNQEKI